MISLLLSDEKEDELDQLEDEFEHLTAIHTDEMLDMIDDISSDNVEELSDRYDFLHMAVLDIVRKQGVSVAKSVRKQFPLSEMMIVADMTISPLEYMTPSVRATSLLLRPVSLDKMKETCEEFFLSSLQRLEIDSEEKMFLVNNSEGKMPIPYDSIYYFEAQNKKISVRTRQEEYEIYDTIEHLLSKLPEEFMRCHRSYIINRKLIKSVKMSEGLITLQGNIIVPLSRSYKKSMKEYINAIKNS